MAETQSAPSLRDALPARRGDWMQTFTGRRFWPLDPRSEDVSIEDIAHALSLLTRYGGHCTRFYSVAEHCVLLARAVPEEHRLWALLHDASEAYIADIVRPLKRHLDGYGAAETRVMAAVAEHFRLGGVEPPEVKAADSRILMDERAQVMRPTGDTWNYGGAREPLGITLPFWTPEQAEREFLALYSELTGYAVEMPPPTTLTEAVASARAEAIEEFGDPTEDELDARIARQGARENMRLIDSISDLLGQPHDVELTKSDVADALASARAEGWQPIETAPAEDEVTVDLWLVDRKSGLEWRQTDTWRHDGRWIVMEFEEIHHVKSEEVVATHWRYALAPPGRSAGLPLPAPPTTPGGRTDG